MSLLPITIIENSMSLNKPVLKLRDWVDVKSLNWKIISENPSIFELDYEAMKRNNEGIYKELIKEVIKPSRVFKNPDYDYLEELFGD